MNVALQNVKMHMGPVYDLLLKDDINDVMINPDGRVWVESATGMMCTGHHISAEKRILIIQSMAHLCGRVVTEAQPVCTGILPETHARFMAVIPPACQPNITLRLPPKQVLTLQHYIDTYSMSVEQARLLQGAVLGHQNVIIAGSTGSGKTSMCNVLLGLLDRSDERIIIIEDAGEIQSQNPNRVEIETDDKWLKPKDALKSTLRMRPDRIIMGELLDGETALQLLMAWNTGHRGGLTTLHADSAQLAIYRFEQLLEMVTQNISRALIAQAVDVIVFMERGPLFGGKKTRRVVDVATLNSTLDAHGHYQFEHHLNNASPQK